MDSLHVKSFGIAIFLQAFILFGLPCLVKSASDPIIRIKLTGTVYSDETIVRFKTTTTTNFDFQYDANKIMSACTTPSIYTTIHAINYAINSIPSPDSLPVIQLGSQINETSSYTLSFANSTGLHGYTLYDKLLDSEIAIDSSTIYTFDGVIGEDPIRFALRYQSSTYPINSICSLTNSGLKTTNSSNIVVGSCSGGMSLIFKNGTPENYTIKIVREGGRIIKFIRRESINTNSEFIELNDLIAGSYVVVIAVHGSESSYHIALL